MKIAFFTDSYYPMLNGVTISVENFAHELRSHGHTVYIFAPKFDGYKDTEKDVYRLSAVKLLSTEPEVHMPFVLPHNLFKEISPRDFDIVHAHGNGFFSFLGYQVAKLKGIPYVLTVHTQHTRYTHYVFNGKLITPRIAATGLRVISNMCDEVITPSLKMKKDLKSYGVTKPITVISNFIYTARFRSAKKNYLHDLCNIPPSSPILLSVGRLGKEKDCSFLLRSFKVIANQNPNVHLVMVGDGEEAKSLKSLVKKLGLGGRVHFPGKVHPKEIPSVYADAEIFVYSSRTETQGIVVLEAAAAGLPFVVVKDDAYAGCIIDGENGYMVSHKPMLFAQKVLELLDDAKKRENFSKKSRELIRANFLPTALANETLEVYKRVLLKKNSGRFRIRNINKATLKRLYRATELLNKIFE
ncbi:MAG: glycosyltransferase [Candidatus Levybacteria bacterium]|nr:glycosyltransferase [Candidatus Levybacteria bacterium]